MPAAFVLAAIETKSHRSLCCNAYRRPQPPALPPPPPPTPRRAASRRVKRESCILTSYRIFRRDTSHPIDGAVERKRPLKEPRDFEYRTRISRTRGPINRTIIWRPRCRSANGAFHKPLISTKDTPPPSRVFLLILVHS